MSDNMTADSAIMNQETGWLSTTTLNDPPDEVLFIGSSASPSEVTKIESGKQINFLEVTFEYNTRPGRLERISYSMEFNVFITTNNENVILPDTVIGTMLKLSMDSESIPVYNYVSQGQRTRFRYNLELVGSESDAIKGCNIKPNCTGYQVINGTNYYIASDNSTYLDSKLGDSVAKKYVAYKRFESYNN